MSFCLERPKVENGFITSEFNPPVPLGTEINFNCNMGYVKHALYRGVLAYTRCTSVNGLATWIPAPSCLPRPCGDPGLVPHAVRIGNLFTYPNKVRYECDEGFQLKGVPELYCSAKGSWSRKPPECQPNVCPSLSNPAHGRVWIDNTKSGHLERGFGAVAKYKCDKEYRLRGLEHRTCQTDGTWEGEEPTCELILCANEPEPYGVLFGSLLRYVPGSTRIINCYDGSHVIQKCLVDGTWSISKRCPPAPMPDHWEKDESEGEDDEVLEIDRNVIPDIISEPRGTSENDPSEETNATVNVPEDPTTEKNPPPVIPEIQLSGSTSQPSHQPVAAPTLQPPPPKAPVPKTQSPIFKIPPSTITSPISKSFTYHFSISTLIMAFSLLLIIVFILFHL